MIHIIFGTYFTSSLRSLRVHIRLRPDGGFDNRRDRHSVDHGHERGVRRCEEVDRAESRLQTTIGIF